MNSRANDWKVGLFVVIGLALLIAAFIVFGASRWFESKTVEETCVSGNVDGLKIGSAVTLHGVPVGEVTRINFSWNVYHRPEPRYVVIEFTVRNSVSLARTGPAYRALIQKEVGRGLRARIKTQGLAGAAILSLEYVNPSQYPPLPVPWKSHHYYIPSAPGQFSEIVSAFDKITAEVQQIDFHQIGAQVQTDLAAGGQVLEHADQVRLGEVGTNINSLLMELRGVAGQAHAYLGDTHAAAGANLEKISTHADQLILELKTLGARLERIGGNLDVNALNQALENLRRATEQLNETLAEIKQYPSGALFGRPPPAARSVESPGH